MKRFFISAVIILFSATAVLANIFIDGIILPYNGTGDADTQFGAGLSVGMESSDRNFNYLFRSLYTLNVKNKNEANEENYSHFMGLLGVEYNYNVPNTQLMWRSSLLGGVSTTSIEKKVNFFSTSTDDTGLSLEITTGIQYNATQHVSPYLDIGYHRSFYLGDLESASIGGFQIMAGVRVSLWNVRDIGADY